MKPLTLDWLHSILIDLAVPVGTSLTVALAAAAVNQLLLCPRRAQEAEDGARHKFLSKRARSPTSRGASSKLTRGLEWKPSSAASPTT